jgi:serine palmitoyltransferase
LEEELAKFIGVEDALTFGMGFGTNSLNIPSLMDSECLVLSDQFNHTSLILGIRLSRAKIVVFNHNDMKDLEARLRSAIVTAHMQRKPWKKIFIIVEGVYSMHGSMAKLPEIIRIKEKYGAYLYLDEGN